MTCSKQLTCLLVLECLFLVYSLGICSCDTPSNSIYVFYPTDGATYNTDSVDLQFQVEQENLESTNITYTLDNVQFPIETYQGHAGANLRVGETILYNLSEGEHTLVIKGTGDFWSYFPPCTEEFAPVTVRFFVNTTPTPTPDLPRNPPHLDPMYYVIPSSIIVAIVIVSTLLHRRHRKNS